jgi:hypothetical protein
VVGRSGRRQISRHDLPGQAAVLRRDPDWWARSEDVGDGKDARAVEVSSMRAPMANPAAELSPAEERITVSHHSCSPQAMAAPATDITDQPTMLASHEFPLPGAVPNPDAAKAPHARTPGHDFTKQRKAAIQP